MNRRVPRAALRALAAAPSLRKPRAESLLEGVAAEFALLAQRKARLRRQIDLLGRQHQAATAVMSQVDARMASLSQRMSMLSPAQAASDPAPPSAPPRRRGALVHS